MLFCNIQVIAQLHQLTHRPVHQTTVHRRLDTLLQVQIIGKLLSHSFIIGFKISRLLNIIDHFLSF